MKDKINKRNMKKPRVYRMKEGHYRELAETSN